MQRLTKNVDKHHKQITHIPILHHQTESSTMFTIKKFRQNIIIYEDAMLMMLYRNEYLFDFNNILQKDTIHDLLVGYNIDFRH